MGKVTARRLAGFGITTVGDLIDHFPRRYEDFRDRKDVRDLKLGEEATVRGVVERVSADRTARKRVTVVRAMVRDGTGAVEATWFNQGYLSRVLEPGITVSVRGTFRPQGGRAPSWCAATRSSARRTARRCTPKDSCRSIRPASRSRRACCAA